MTKKAVSQVKVGEKVRPEADWVGHNASCSVTFPLNTKKNFKVQRELKDGWLGLEPSTEEYFTTIVYVRFNDPDRQIKVVG